MVLDTSPDVVCSQGEWQRNFGAAVFFLLLVPVGVPLVFAGGLLAAKAKFDETTFALRYGFLTIRYKQQWFFYELIVILRKLLVVVAITFIASSAFIKAGAVYAVIGVSALFHHTFKPYEYPRHNRYESFCLFMLSGTIVVALTYQDSTLAYGVVTGIM